MTHRCRDFGRDRDRKTHRHLSKTHFRDGDTHHRAKMRIYAATTGIIAASKRKAATTKLFGARRKSRIAAPIILVAAAMSFAVPAKIRTPQKCPESRRKCPWLSGRWVESRRKSPASRRQGASPRCDGSHRDGEIRRQRGKPPGRGTNPRRPSVDAPACDRNDFARGGKASERGTKRFGRDGDSGLAEGNAFHRGSNAHGAHPEARGRGRKGPDRDRNAREWNGNAARQDANPWSHGADVGTFERRAGADQDADLIRPGLRPNLFHAGKDAGAPRDGRRATTARTAEDDGRGASSKAFPTPTS